MVSRQMFPDVPRNPPDVPRNPPDVPRNPPDVPRNPPDVPRCSQMFPGIPQMFPGIPQMFPDVPRNPACILRVVLTNHIVYNHVYLSEAIHELYNVLCETIIRYTTCNFIVAMCISEYLVRCRGPVRGRARVV
jgi:hypothetical protein